MFCLLLSAVCLLLKPQYLDLGFNLISGVGEVSFPALKYLNLERNRLSDIDGAFNLLSSLQVCLPFQLFVYSP